MKHLPFLLVLLSTVPIIQAQEEEIQAEQEGQLSLTALANKEKARREQNAAVGKTSGQLMTNVMPASNKSELAEVPKFQTLERYERVLHRTVKALDEVCRGFAGIWRTCSGVSPDEATAVCRVQENAWEHFLGVEFESHAHSRWNKRCMDSFKTTKETFEQLRTFYHYLYLDYRKLATEKGRSEGLLARQVPEIPQN